ncbi:MAG: NAD-dependent epimerase/dehydratase family protein [Candidatus Sericytochromatia bacterium]|nr:NAD-dependent epimerase/dehydratase family protein [Candidatus Sericytochromatia bacterium]
MTVVKPPLPADELASIAERLGPLWNDLDGAHVLLTGGTGFWGTWLLESCLWVADRQGLDVRLDVLTRDPARFMARSGHLASHPRVRLLAGDVTTFAGATPYSHILHAATDTSGPATREASLAYFDTLLSGTRAVLEAARPTRARVLLASSGAVYGPQPRDLTHVPEDFGGGPRLFTADSIYAEGKRAGETLGALAAKVWGVPVVVARGFAFVGPHLPLDQHFAIGNFIGDGLLGRPIRVGGDGTPWRSYMYAADMAVWLWTMLLRGEPGVAYNLGSDEAVTIRDVAGVVGAQTGQPVHVSCTPVPGVQALRYVPCIRLARDTLGLTLVHDVADGIRRTLAWHRSFSVPG